jgi:hypothetical protein
MILKVITDTKFKYNLTFQGTTEEQKKRIESYIENSKKIQERFDWQYIVEE